MNVPRETSSSGDLPPIEWTSSPLSDILWTRSMLKRAKDRLNDLERLRDGQRIVFEDVLDKERRATDHSAVDDDTNKEVDL